MAGRKIDELYYDITARTGGFTKGLGAAQTAMGKFRKLLGGAGLTSGLVAFGAAAVAAGIKATKMAASLDSALREVSTLLPGTVDNISDLRKEIIALSEQVPETPELLTKGLYQVISAGITDTAEAMGVLAVAAKAATAGVTDTFTSVDAITTVLNAYGLAASEASNVSDVLFQTVKAGKTTFGELSANIGTVATSAALAGVSIEEVGAALATMTKFGIDTARSATALDALFRSVTSATDEQRAAAKALGVEYTVAGLRAKGLAGFLRELEAATGGSVEGLAAITTQAEAQRAAFVLAGQGAEEFGKILAETNEAAGATGDAFGKVNGSLENQSALLKNKINAAWLNLGNDILPLVLAALEQVNRLLESDAETIARLYERVGLAQEALEIRLAESQGRIAEGLGKSQEALERAFQRFALLRNEFERGGGGPQSGRGTAGLFAALDELVSQAGRETLIPDLVSTTSLEQARQLVDAGLAYGKGLEQSLELTAGQRKALAEVLDRQTRIRGEIEAQLAGEVALAKAAQNLGRARGELTRPESPASDEPAGGIARARDEAEKLVDGLRDVQRVLEEAGASGADLFSAVPSVIAEVQERIDELGRSLDTDLEQFDLDTRLLQAQRAIEGVTRSGASFGDQALAVQGILQAWKVTVDQLPAGFRGVAQAIVDVGDEATDVDDSLRDVIQQISFAARSAVELAGAFGFVGDEAAAVVNQVALIGEGIGRIASGDILGGLTGAVSGIAGIVSAVGGPSQSELERIESEREIARRLRALTNSVDLLISVMSQLPGQLTTDLKEALGTALAGITIQKDDDLPSLIENAKATDRIKAALAAAKVDIEDIQRLNADLGLPIDQLIRLLEGETLNAEQLIEALQQAQGLFDGITLEVQDMSKSVADALGFLQAGFDRFDVDEPLKQLDAISKKLGELGVNLTGEELKRLAAGDEGLIEELLRQAIEGSGRFTTLDDFGKLNQEELIRFLDELERIGDRLESEQADGGREGDFQQVSAQNRFTVEQADRGLAQDATRNALLERILEEIRGGVGLGALPVITDRTLAAAATIRVEHSGGFVVDVRGDAVDVQSAAVIRDGLVEHLSVDRYLGEQARNIRAGYGLPSRSVQ
ncbi:MAG: phage tail tape measure protein [Gemmatimonadota bacterium]